MPAEPTGTSRSSTDLALLELHVAVLGELRLGHRADVRRRRLERGDAARARAASAALALRRRGPERIRVATSPAAERAPRSRRRRHRRRARTSSMIAATGSLTSPEGGLQRRGSRPRAPARSLPSQSKRLILIAPPPGAAARPGRRPRRRAACGRRGWRSAARCEVAISSRISRPFSSRVRPVATRSTMPSARPISGASSTEPFTSITSALAAGLLEVALGDPRVLGRDAHPSESPLGLAEALVAPAARQHHPAGAVGEVEDLVDDPVRLLLEQHVLAGDPEVGRAGLDVGGHVGGSHGHQGEAVRCRRRASASRPASRRCRARSRPARRASRPRAPRAGSRASAARPGGRGSETRPSAGSSLALPHHALLLHLGHVHPLQVEPEPGGRHRRPKRPTRSS